MSTEREPLSQYMEEELNWFRREGKRALLKFAGAETIGTIIGSIGLATNRIELFGLGMIWLGGGQFYVLAKSLNLQKRGRKWSEELKRRNAALKLLEPISKGTPDQNLPIPPERNFGNLGSPRRFPYLLQGIEESLREKGTPGK